jgi:hypothetical protein
MGSRRSSIALLLLAACSFCRGGGEADRAANPQLASILARLPSGTSNVQVTRGDLNGDASEEFAVCYEESLQGVVLAIMDSSLESRFVLPVSHDRATTPRLFDMDSDGRFEVVLRGPSRGGESLKVIRGQEAAFTLVGDFWGLEVDLLDDDGDGTLEVEVENRDFERDPSKYTVHTFYRWDGVAFSPFRSFRAAKKLVF